NTSHLMEGFTMKYLFTKMSGVVLGVFLLLGFHMAAQAADATQNPKVIIESVAQELFDLVKAKNAAKTADDVYFKQVEAAMDGVVDFPFIAATVMGKGYKQATVSQRKQFLEAFKSGMVRSLAKGVLGYADSKVVVAGVNE